MTPKLFCFRKRDIAAARATAIRKARPGAALAAMESVHRRIFAQWHSDNIVDAVKASRLCADSAVREYFHAWKGAQGLVYALLPQQLTKMTWKELRDASRPGAWLADLVCTALRVEMGLIKRNAPVIPATAQAPLQQQDW